MQRPHYLLFGALGYSLAVVPMAYFAAFLAGVGVPMGVDSGVDRPLTDALFVDVLLLAAFAVVHSLFARPAIKRRLSRWISHELERSVYSVVAGLQVILLVLFWRPLPEPVWSVDTELARSALWALFALGWGLVVWALAAIGSGHLFGWRAALAAARGEAYRMPGFRAVGPYSWLRHPLYSGTVLALFAAPDMSQGHLLLAIGLTAYIVVGARLEERDLVREQGAAYARYRESVPGFLPFSKRSARHRELD